MTETIILASNRNLITFCEFIEIDYSICSSALCCVLDYLKTILADSKKYSSSRKDRFEIRANEYNWSLRLTTKSQELISIMLECILANEKCCYLEINKIIHQDGKYNDILELSYHPLSFRQPDNTIRNAIINTFQNENIDAEFRNIVLLGGECTLFGRLFNDTIAKHFITDYKSIYEDLKCNHSRSDNISLVDYKKCSLEWKKYSIDNGIWGKYEMCIIANTGYQGLGKHLANELLHSGADTIYIVSCNEISFRNDYIILAEDYKIDWKKEIKTNYSVWIYKLSIS